MKKLLLTVLLLFSFSAFSQTVIPITEKQAIEIAKQEAIKAGSSPEWFGGKTMTNFDGEKWSITFIGKPSENGYLAAGDYLTVELLNDGKVLRVIPGL